MDSTFEYYINSYPSIDYDPGVAIMLDSFLTLRRNKPRPMRLSVVPRESNPALGAGRAHAVRDHPAGRGVASSRIATLSWGKERPIDPGSNEDAWARNRNGHTVIVEGAR